MRSATVFGGNPRYDGAHIAPALSSLCLRLLIAADVAFVALHVFARLAGPAGASPLLLLGTEGGYAEMLQYLKYYWIALMLAMLCWRRREAVYAAWGVLYVYLLCDDALGIHETAGRYIAAAFHYGPALGLRAQDFGELLVSASAGCVLLGLILVCYERASSEARSASRDLVLLLGVLVFFGVFADMAHVMAQNRYLREGFAIMEDGGELVAASLAFWYVLRLLEGGGVLSLWRWTLRLVIPR
jgi:hypothetical protein